MTRNGPRLTSHAAGPGSALEKRVPRPTPVPFSISKVGAIAFPLTWPCWGSLVRAGMARKTTPGRFSTRRSPVRHRRRGQCRSCVSCGTIFRPTPCSKRPRATPRKPRRTPSSPLELLQRGDLKKAREHLTWVREKGASRSIATDLAKATLERLDHPQEALSRMIEDMLNR